MMAAPQAAPTVRLTHTSKQCTPSGVFLYDSCGKQEDKIATCGADGSDFTCQSVTKNCTPDAGFQTCWAYSYGSANAKLQSDPWRRRSLRGSRGGKAGCEVAWTLRGGPVSTSKVGGLLSNQNDGLIFWCYGRLANTRAASRAVSGDA